MTQLKSVAAAIAVSLGLCQPAWAKTSPCANPKALGTARVLQIGSSGGLAIGLKTYPQTLALGDHELVLTFDDGPRPATTPAVLEALAAECVQATFFLIGRNAEAAPALVRQEIAAGHTVGHHSFSHPAVTLRGWDEARALADIERGIEANDIAAYGAASADPRVPFFRFPGFADTLPLLKWLDRRNMAVFGADIWASDWEEMTPQEELSRLMSRIEKARHGIVLLHDIRVQTVAMLPAFLRELKTRGYSIVHIEPGAKQPDVELAGARWTSQTERSLARLGYGERPDDAAPALDRPALKGPL